jgi:G:T/U-mismatch repair DNA glycosylase
MMSHAQLFFNGVKAEQCFRRHVQPSLKSQPLQYRRLPSTSPANARTSYEKKLGAWRAVIQRGKDREAGTRLTAATFSGEQEVH